MPVDEDKVTSCSLNSPIFSVYKFNFSGSRYLLGDSNPSDKFQYAVRTGSETTNRTGLHAQGKCPDKEAG